MPTVKPTDTELWRRSVRGYLSYEMEVKNVSSEKLAKALRINVRTLDNKINNPETFWMHEMLQIAKVLKCPLENLVLGDAEKKTTKDMEDVIVVMSEVMQSLAKVLEQKG